MSLDWSQIKHFEPEEFDSPDAPGSGKNMDLNFVSRLDILREKFGKSISIDSGYRSKDHNSSVGGVSDSAHTEGVGADLLCESSQERFFLLLIAIQLGFRRIGIGKNFLHLDASTTLPQDVIFLYKDC